MISLVEALRYRSLRYVRQRLRPFHVLVGPNASGKSSFLDVIGFLSQLVSDGLEAAIETRTRDFRDLIWAHEGDGFELSIEAQIPADRRDLLAVKKYDTVRYEVGIARDETTSEISIVSERGWLVQAGTGELQARLDFPEPAPPPKQIITQKRKPNTRTLFSKKPGGNDNYYADARELDGRWAPSFKLGPRKSTLGNLPEDESNFPVSTWFKQLLSNGVERIVLNSERMRLSSPPGQGTGFRPDGSNLPWVVSALESRSPDRLAEWVSHLRMALPDVQRIYTKQRDDDRHRYLVIEYSDGLAVPSWMASDGTLRLLALTLPAYLDALKGIYLIEEPENGIHPRAIETMYQSLSSVYDAQILLASHSPVILGAAQPEDVLCFAKSHDGATDIVAGDKHPRLHDWHGEVTLGTLFAAGVLG